MKTKKTLLIARIIVFVFIAFYFQLSTFNCYAHGLSNSATGTAANSPAAALIAPVANAGSGATETQITVNWSASSGADHYHLDVSTSIGFASFLTGLNNYDAGNVTSYNVTGLTCGTTYFYRVKAENSCNTSPNSNLIAYATSPCFFCGTSTVNDIDGNTYNTVSIGSQCWLKENMHTTKYPDGASITKGTTWNYYDVALYSCPPNVSNNGEDCNAAASLGLLYQWSAAMYGSTTPGAQGICPAGWHVPTDAEWCTMENTVEAGTDASCNTTGQRGVNTGSKITADVADQSWNTYTNGLRTGTGFNNTSGLNIGPSGTRDDGGSYMNRGLSMYLWTSNVKDSENKWNRFLTYSSTKINRSFKWQGNGCSVRCIKD
ncbi:MAG: hypothetical protein HGB12_08900 [Bacteroidetes bacterium]|nr:hypothetical protein [Bacteroidota bacterium]